MIRKILCILLMLFMIMGLCSCGNDAQGNGSIAREENALKEDMAEKIDVENQTDENVSQTDSIILGEWKCVTVQEGDKVIPVMDDSYVLFNEDKNYLLHLDDVGFTCTGKWEYEGSQEETQLWKLTVDDENIECIAGVNGSLLIIRLGDMNLGFMKLESEGHSDSIGSERWKYYEENSNIPTPDSCVKSISLKKSEDDNYVYELSNDLDDAEMDLRAYGAVLIGCGFAVEEKDGLYMILDDSEEIVAAMGIGKENNEYLMIMYVW